MSSPAGIDKINWYATNELQFVLCMCCKVYQIVKYRHGKVSDERFMVTLKHKVPHVEEYLPAKDISYKDMVNRFVQRGHKTNDFNKTPNEHPTHDTKKSSTGRFWASVCKSFDHGNSLTREDVSKIIAHCTGTKVEMPLYFEATEPPTATPVPVSVPETSFTAIKERLSEIDEEVSTLTSEREGLVAMVRKFLEEISK